MGCNGLQDDDVLVVVEHGPGEPIGKLRCVKSKARSAGHVPQLERQTSGNNDA